MEKKIAIPEGVSVSIGGLKVTAKGKNAELVRDFGSPLFSGLKVESDGKAVKVSSVSNKRGMKSEVGCITSIIENMMAGAAKDFVRMMKVVFMHFPITVKAEGDRVVITNFLGERAPREAKIVGRSKVVIGKDEITVTGPSCEDVGQTCANMERATRIARRDRRVYQDGIFLVG